MSCDSFDGEMGFAGARLQIPPCKNLDLIINGKFYIILIINDNYIKI